MSIIDVRYWPRQSGTLRVVLGAGFLGVFALPLRPAGAQMPFPDSAGRYQGRVIGQRKDGTSAERPVFLLVKRDSGAVTCEASLVSFDEGFYPCARVSAGPGTLAATMPAWGGVSFALREESGRVAGTMTAAAGGPADPYQRMELKRTGDLTLSDLVPRIPGEDFDRSPRLLRLRRDLALGLSDSLAGFWSDVTRAGAPIVEPIVGEDSTYLVTFVWRGAADTKSVLVFWRRFALARPGDYLMTKVPGSDLWFRTTRLRLGTRIYYQISPNDPVAEGPQSVAVRKAQADPLNPHRDVQGDGVPIERARSLLELPGAKPEPWYARNDNPVHYAVAETTIVSKVLGSSRRIRIYTPPGYSPRSTAYPTAYFFDGEDPDGYVFATWTLENLIDAKRIPPTVVVRIANQNQASRQSDLECNEKYAQFLASELVPFVRRHFNVSADPAKTLIGGYSLGGLGAAFAAFRRPDVFGLVLSQSGAFWYDTTSTDNGEPNWLAREFAKAERRPLRLYLEAGRYELDFRGLGGNILIPNRELRDVLVAKGYAIHYSEFPGEHEPINWRGTFADGMMWLLGSKKTLPP